jgi:hypothetical protein
VCFQVEGALTVAAGLRANGLSVDLFVCGARTCDYCSAVAGSLVAADVLWVRASHGRLLQPKRAKGAFDSGARPVMALGSDGTREMSTR